MSYPNNYIREMFAICPKCRNRIYEDIKSTAKCECGSNLEGIDYLFTQEEKNLIFDLMKYGAMPSYYCMARQTEDGPLVPLLDENHIIYMFKNLRESLSLIEKFRYDEDGNSKFDLIGTFIGENDGGIKVLFNSHWVEKFINPDLRTINEINAAVKKCRIDFLIELLNVFKEEDRNKI